MGNNEIGWLFSDFFRRQFWNNFAGHAVKFSGTGFFFSACLSLTFFYPFCCCGCCPEFSDLERNKKKSLLFVFFHINLVRKPYVNWGKSTFCHFWKFLCCIVTVQKEVPIFGHWYKLPFLFTVKHSLSYKFICQLRQKYILLF